MCVLRHKRHAEEHEKRGDSKPTCAEIEPEERFMPQNPRDVERGSHIRRPALHRTERRRKKSACSFRIDGWGATRGGQIRNRKSETLEIGKVKLENGEKNPHPREPRVGSSGIWCERPPTVTSSEAPNDRHRGLISTFHFQLEATTPRHVPSVQN